MKRKLNITLCLFMALTFIINMFTPLSVLAIGNSRSITIVWNCNNGDICGNAVNINDCEIVNGHKVCTDTNMIEGESLRDGGYEFKAADITSYGKMNHTPQFYIFNGTMIDESKATGSWSNLTNKIRACTNPDGPDPSCNWTADKLPLDPAGARDGLTSVGHNGDQNFRLIIYDAGTKFVKFDVDEDNYKYILGGWNPILANPTYELSTNPEKPTEYNTYLLEKKLTFFTEEDIKSVKALDVSNKGISINVIDKRKVDVTFNSNYFSDVVFEITFENGSKGYIKVNRQFVRFADNNETYREDGKREAYAEFIYPEDKSYEDYDVYATYTVGDKTETKKLTAVKTKMINPFAGPGENPYTEGMTVNTGKWLSSTRYLLNITKDTKDVSITVTKKGAIEGNTYGGTFGGNGKGVKLDIARFVHMLNDAGGRQ